MKGKNTGYKKDVAFINRKRELNGLQDYIDIRPESILFIHGPKSSGKTTLLYKFFDRIEWERKLDVKFINLRKTFTEFSDKYDYKDFLSVFFQVESKEKDNDRMEKLPGGINVGFFKIDAEIEKKMQEGRVDPFKVMEREFLQLKDKGIKPVLIIDELQALDKTYMNDGRERRLIIEVFNFFVAMTKESHLAHIIIASSDGYFLNTVYNDSKLKKTSEFYKVDYLCREDVMEWLSNLEKYSKITDYKLTEEDAEKIWDTVGGSMWEIQSILSQLFDHGLDDVLALYKKKMRGIIAHYCQFEPKKKQVLQVVNEKKTVTADDFSDIPLEALELEEILRDMVTNNILYFDPTDAVYYPQGKSFEWGIHLYFQRMG